MHLYLHLFRSQSAPCPYTDFGWGVRCCCCCNSAISGRNGWINGDFERLCFTRFTITLLQRSSPFVEAIFNSFIVNHVFVCNPQTRHRLFIHKMHCCIIALTPGPGSFSLTTYNLHPRMYDRCLGSRPRHLHDHKSLLLFIRRQQKHLKPWPSI